jgi:hypothetical protein
MGYPTACECSDPGCSVNHGSKECGQNAEDILYRVDMEDRSGTAMCEDCASDAFEAGVFSAFPVDAEIEEIEL